MELFIFITFQLLTEVQSDKSPAVKVSSDVISESSSVEMICETPGDVPVKQCYFYPNRDERNIKVSWSCKLALSGAEVLRWADVKSPASVDIHCYYTTIENGIDKPSPHSPAVTVTVLGLPQAKLTASASVIKETDTVQLSCENNEDQTMEMECFFNINGRENSGKLSSSCQVSLTGSEIRIWSEGQSSSVKITCFYTVKKSRGLTKYPRSDPVTVTVQISMTTPTPGHSTESEHETWFIVLVSTGVGVILTGFFCLCWLASKKRRKHNERRSITSDVPSQEIGMSSGPAETYSLITSVPATSQPVSAGLEHPDTHQDSTPDPTAAYSFIMSENPVYQPSDVLVNSQEKEGNTVENENVYHLYCTIPDKPVHSKAADQVYSLVKMH